MLIEKLPVQSVETDMNDHTVTVAFDDDEVALESVVESLNDAGYVVKSRRQLD